MTKAEACAAGLVHARDRWLAMSNEDRQRMFEIVKGIENVHSLEAGQGMIVDNSARKYIALIARAGLDVMIATDPSLGPLPVDNNDIIGG